MKPYYRKSGITIYQGDSLTTLNRLPDETVQMCITSPPYFGLRDYGVPGQIGLEPTPEEFTKRLVDVFREVRRVLKNDGTLWLNLGDSYAGSGMTGGTNSKEASVKRQGRMFHGNRRDIIPGLKPKDLIGIPWRVAFALQADGWYLRSDIIWHKPNPMPESVTDRPTKGHEYLFLLAKSERYLYNADAVAESAVSDGHIKPRPFGNKNAAARNVKSLTGNMKPGVVYLGRKTRNRRTVWTVTTRPYKGAHFATFPPKLIEPCILAGSRPGDVVLDPFNGAGTTGMVSLEHGRKYLGLELNPEYCDLTIARLESAKEASRDLRRAA